MKAIDYIRRGWTQRVSARNRYGTLVDFLSPTAVCWCAWGSICIAYNNTMERRKAMEKLQPFIDSFQSGYGRSGTKYGDGTACSFSVKKSIKDTCFVILAGGTTQHF